MSLATLETSLVNFAKKIKEGLSTAEGDALKVAAFVENNSAEITGLASLAGGGGTVVANAGLSLLNVVINAVKGAGDAAASNGLSVTLDASVIAEVKAVIAAIEKVK